MPSTVLIINGTPGVVLFLIVKFYLLVVPATRAAQAGMADLYS